jgi:5'-3' exonuclease
MAKYIQKLIQNEYILKDNLDTIKHIVFVDTSYYTFYRFHSLINWYKLSHKDIVLEEPINEKEFVDKFRQTYVEKLKEIPKKLNIADEPFTICFGKDCPRENIWRKTHFPEYKATRDDYSKVPQIKNPGPFFKIAYNEELYKEAFPKSTLYYHPNLEADDCIALLVKKISETYPNIKITIFTSDNDYLQLINNENIQILNMQYKSISNEKTSFGNSKKDLLCKIITGDTSDNIQGIFKRCGRKTAIQYIDNMDLFQKQLEKENAFEKYKLNRLLIDFDMIPDELKNEFYTKYSKGITKQECFCDNLDYNNENIESIIKIQSLFRRNNIKYLKDGFTKQILEEFINKFNELYLFYNEMNTKLKNKQARKPNYPSEITENLVKFAIIKKYNVSPCWDTKKGDLCLYDKHLEVKGSIDLINGGPSSFGPDEEWHRIYFVDAVECNNKKFKIYEIKLSNKSSIWKNIKVNKNETYQEQCLQKRRPRITFTDIIKQIPENFITILFDGYFTDL